MPCLGPALGAEAVEKRQTVNFHVSICIGGREGRGLDAVVVLVVRGGGTVFRGCGGAGLVGEVGEATVGAFERAPWRAVADDHTGCGVEECAVEAAVERDPVGGDIRHSVRVDGAI